MSDQGEAALRALEQPALELLDALRHLLLGAHERARRPELVGQLVEAQPRGNVRVLLEQPSLGLGEGWGEGEGQGEEAM